MADEPEKPAIRLLQELCEEMREQRAEVRALRTEVADLVQRVDGNTLVFNLVAGVAHDHEVRTDRLEAR